MVPLAVDLGNRHLVVSEFPRGQRQAVIHIKSSAGRSSSAGTCRSLVNPISPIKEARCLPSDRSAVRSGEVNVLISSAKLSERRPWTAGPKPTGTGGRSGRRRFEAQQVVVRHHVVVARGVGGARLAVKPEGLVDLHEPQAVEVRDVLTGLALPLPWAVGMQHEAIVLTAGTDAAVD